MPSTQNVKQHQIGLSQSEISRQTGNGSGPPEQDAWLQDKDELQDKDDVQDKDGPGDTDSPGDPRATMVRLRLAARILVQAALSLARSAAPEDNQAI